MSRISAPRSFDSAPRAVPRDKSVRRFAQDDDFVGGLKKNTPNRLTLVGRSPGLSSAVPTGLGSRHLSSHAVSLAPVPLPRTSLRSSLSGPRQKKPSSSLDVSYSAPAKP